MLCLDPLNVQPQTGVAVMVQRRVGMLQDIGALYCSYSGQSHSQRQAHMSLQS